jgi:two-component system sensor histidine kinase KdpD
MLASGGSAICPQQMNSSRGPTSRVQSYVAIPAAASAMLVTGTLDAGLHGQMPVWSLLATIAAIVVGAGYLAGPRVLPLTAAIGWLTSIGFARAPYGQLQFHGVPVALSAVVLLAATGIGVGANAISRGVGTTLDDVTSHEAPQGVEVMRARRLSLVDLASAVDKRRRWAGVIVAIVLLTGLTTVLTGLGSGLDLADELLIYLLAVIAVAVVGGFGPAVGAAIAASLCLNWFFTPPLHTLTIQKPTNLLALLLFILVATSVSSVVHLAARRATLAARSAAEAHALLALARTVLGPSDTPSAVLEHLNATFGVEAELQERTGHRWVRIASAGSPDSEHSQIFPVRWDLRLVAESLDPDVTPALLEASARLAAASLDRDRLRTQASQAEALEAGNLMRTALLAAVSHDLRTPLASIKASVSSLRQPDLDLPIADQAELLATVEESADRLDGLIANLLDMSRLQTGALQPFVQPVAVEEVAPLALHGLPGGNAIKMDVPDGLPLLRADGGLLERALANLLSNALRYSPADRPPTLRARVAPTGVVISVVDHGPGVVVAQRETMFAPFQRLGDHDTATGIGLGLAVARGFVDAMGGSIHATETPGGGLTMVVTLGVATASSVPSHRANS